jgi:hypothetical protein
MKLTSLVVSVHIAQRLKNFNLSIISCFYWHQEKITEDPQLFANDISQNMMPWKLTIGKPDYIVYKELSAYCASELGELLPRCIVALGIEYILSYLFHNQKWEYFYYDIETNKNLISVSASTEQDARALLLIAIIENKYIDISQTLIK